MAFVMKRARRLARQAELDRQARREAFAEIRALATTEGVACARLVRLGRLTRAEAIESIRYPPRLMLGLLQEYREDRDGYGVWIVQRAAIYRKACERSFLEALGNGEAEN